METMTAQRLFTLSYKYDVPLRKAYNDFDKVKQMGDPLRELEDYYESLNKETNKDDK